MSQIILINTIKKLLNFSDVQVQVLMDQQLSLFVTKEALLSDSLPLKSVLFDALSDIFKEGYLSNLFYATLHQLYTNQSISNPSNCDLMVISLRIGSNLPEYFGSPLRFINEIVKDMKNIDERITFRSSLEKSGIATVFANLSKKVQKESKVLIEKYKEQEKNDKLEIESSLSNYENIFHPLFENNNNFWVRCQFLLEGTGAEVLFEEISKLLFIVLFDCKENPLSISKLKLLSNVAHRLAFIGTKNKNDLEGIFFLFFFLFIIFIFL